MKDKTYGPKKHSMAKPLILVFVFVVIMVIYTSRLTYSVAVMNSNSVIEDRLANVSSLIENHMNTAENVLVMTADSVHHMLISGSTPARIHEFLVEETNNVERQFGEDYTGLYGYIMSQYMDGQNWEPPEGYDPKSRDWYTVAREKDGEAAIVPPYVDAQTGNLIISVTRMLPDRQNIISLDVQLNGIQKMMDELTVNGKGYGFVMDENGLIIAHADEEKKGTYLTDSEEGESLFDTIKTNGTGHYEHSFNGRKSTFFVNRLSDDWYVVISVSEREMYQEVGIQLVVNVLICSIIFIMIAMFYYLGYKNEQNYRLRMEEMKAEERRQEYETRMLKVEKDAADEANRAKSNFLANMSHEIRTPMNAIIGMDEMILRESGEPKIRKYAMNIQSAGKTLLSIINDILDLSKIESGKMVIIPVEYDFASVLNDIVNMTMTKAGRKGLEYELNADPDIPSVMLGDEIRIRQIILNLVNNAIKYTNEGSVKVNVSFDRSVDRLKVRVEDTGMGIRESDMDKLFSSFQRLDETKNRNVEGAGLGLNITKQLVEMMGGSIRVESEYRKGSVFTVEIKQEIVDGTPIGSYSERLKETADEKYGFKPSLIAPKAKILIVDDNEMNLEVITELIRDTKIKVTTALSGSECISLLRERQFDVILLDQMMPEMSGTKTLEIIRSEHLADEVPVIALTADAIVGARDSYISEGFTDYLSKPVIYEELENLLIKYLDDSLIMSEADIRAAEEEKQNKDKEKPVILVINSSPEKLDAIKESLSENYKGVYVRDEESAEKYLSKHKPDYIMRES
ncbi:MAG: response regulator [Lachnospiraceae bacterium]|nr:response regulator [Lachnospiraceae bacterium]